MKTQWGALAVADAHVHFFSYGFFAALAKQKGGVPPEDLPGLIGWQAPPARPEDFAAVWARELDSHGVDQAVLIASVPGDTASVAAAVKALPERFFGYQMCDPTAGEPPAQGLQGICLFPAMHGYSMHDERVRPILNFAAANPGTAVFVHCGALSVGVRKKLGLPSKFDMRYSNPIDLHAIALEYPGVPFVVPHFGAGYLRETLMLADMCPNVYLDTSSSNSWMSWHTPPLELIQVFRQALQVAGPRRLLFGSDSSFFPRGWHSAIFEAQTAALARIGIGSEDAASILGGNLRRILKRA